MYFRKTSDTNLCKLLLQTRICWFVFRSNCIWLNKMDSSFNKIKHSGLLNGPTKSNVLILSKIKFNVLHYLHNKNDSQKFVKSTQSKNENQKPKHGDQKNTTQKRAYSGAKKKSTQSNIFEKIGIKKGNLITILLGLSGLYYFTHLVVSPITKRRKFHLFSKNQTTMLGKVQSDYFQYKFRNHIETSGANYRRVSRIVDAMLKANHDLHGVNSDKSWDIFIVNKSEIVNSIVFANRDIIVYTGLLDAVENDDHLAAVLSHGIAHVLLDHSAQISTWKRMLLSVVLFPMVTVYGILPVVLAAMLSPFLRTFSVSILNRPMSKKLEREADRLSIEIVSKACFDPRKVKEFWKAMDDLRQERRVKILKAHPVNQMRYDNCDSQIPKAFNILRKNCAGNLHPFIR